MQLKEPPRDPSTSQYVNFKAIGDKFQGRFMSYAEANGNFGPKKQLTLKTADGVKKCDCPSHLTLILDAHASELHGKIVTVTLIGFKPTNKGNPQKLFHVDAANSLVEVQAPNIGFVPSRQPGDDSDQESGASDDPF